MDMPMTPSRESLRAEVLANYEVFRATLPELLRNHAGRFAAYRHGELAQIFDTFGDALAYCAGAFGDRLFSIQEITDEAVDMGWFAHASGETPLRPDGRTAH